ncbi:MAG: glycerol-3-phosphate dehydrogenase [Pseudomonadales bacterium]|nr:glycerol-3-phosphate dehydrogenase [Pseudomonadales bacterium]
MKAQNRYDVIIIGGGIHGTGVAAEAASRGLSVLLCEKDDLASGASSRTTSLISGGLNRLEKLELDLVRKSFQEQAILRKRAPHLLRHLSFYIPVVPALRPKRKLKAGILLYNSLRPAESRKFLQNRQRLPSEDKLAADKLKPAFQDVLAYDDCSINDSRLVVSNALLAKKLGAEILTRVAVKKAYRQKDHWQVTLSSDQVFECKALVNASGADINTLLAKALPNQSRCVPQLVRGDQIIVPKLYKGYYGFLLQMHDGQAIYTLPYKRDYTLIGSVEQLWTPELEVHEAFSMQAIDTLCLTVNDYFNQQITADDVVKHSWAVRTVYDDTETNPQRMSYDTVLDLDCPDGHSPLVNIFGGRLTTYRLASRQVMDVLRPYTRAEKTPGFSESFLPGGDIIDGSMNNFVNELQVAYPWLDEEPRWRYARLYGSLTHQILQNCMNANDMGHHYGHHLYQCEVNYLKEHEWAKSADDILWRRTRLGIVFNEAETQNLQKNFNN